jgi:hypothetical protein
LVHARTAHGAAAPVAATAAATSAAASTAGPAATSAAPSAPAAPAGFDDIVETHVNPVRHDGFGMCWNLKKEHEDFKNNEVPYRYVWPG